MSLLDDVSIVVTPNGYKAGELYAVVPVPSEGAEEITNGDFATDSAWTLSSGLTFSAGAILFDDDNDNLFQNKTPTLNTRYKLTITKTGSGTLRFRSGFAGTDGVRIDIPESGIIYFTSTSDTNRIQIYGDISDVSATLNSVSVKEYTAADMDVTRATAATRVDEAGLVNYAEIVGSEQVTNGDFVTNLDGWILSASTPPTWDNGMIKMQSDGATFSVADQSFSTISGKLYTFVFEKLINNNTVEVKVGTSQGGSSLLNLTPTTIQTYTYSFIATSSTSWIRARDGSGTTGAYLSGFSVKEVTRDNVPRIDYSGGGCPHILAEPQRTNTLTYSEDFSQSFWNQITATVTSTTNTNPSGTSGTYSVERVTGSQLGASFSVTSGNDYTASWYVRNISGTGAIIIKDTNNSTNNFTATSEWQRFSVTANASSGTGRCYMQVPTINDEVEVWGAQFEEGSYATSYIPTSGSTVTRNQDIFTRDGIGSLINSTEGVLFVEIEALENGGSNRVISLSDETNDNLMFIRIDATASRIVFFARGVSGTYNIMTVNGVNQTNNNKIALVWDATNVRAWINGGQSITSTINNLPSGMTNLSLTDPTGGDNFFGKVKQLQVYKTALTDEQLLQLTGTSGTDFYESYAEMASALTYTIQ